MAGLAPGNLRVIKASAANEYALSEEDVEKAVREVEAQGLVPFFICANVSATAPCHQPCPRPGVASTASRCMERRLLALPVSRAAFPASISVHTEASSSSQVTFLWPLAVIVHLHSTVCVALCCLRVSMPSVVLRPSVVCCCVCPRARRYEQVMGHFLLRSTYPHCIHCLGAHCLPVPRFNDGLVES